MADVKDEVPKHYYNQEAKNLAKIKGKWWAQPEDEIHLHVFGVYDKIVEQQHYRKNANIKHARLYANQEISGLMPGEHARVIDSQDRNRVTYNVVRSCVDTAGSKIAKSKPRPLFLTKKGDASLQRKAKNLTRYQEGWFEQEKVYEKGRLVFRDGGVFGTGGVKFYKNHEEGKVCLERVFIDEIVVDDIEGFYNEPRQLTQRRYMYREVLLDMYGSDKKKRQAILSATKTIDGRVEEQSSADMLLVLESWHLPSGKKADDGKHVICIENCTLFTEDWKKPFFPFVWWRWSPRLVGFFGSGLAEELEGIQIEIDDLLMKIGKALDLVAVPRVFDSIGSNVPPSTINNEWGQLIQGLSKPEFFTPTAMTPEVYQHLENLYQKAFAITGISMMAATAKKDAGLNSGVALREKTDIESDRFMLVGQSWEEFYMEISKMNIYFTRELHEELKADKRDVKVKVKGSKFMETINWKDVDLEDDQYSMGIFPTSILPTTPAGKLETVRDLMVDGFIDKAAANSLLDFPDLEATRSLTTANVDMINLYIENMLDKGQYEAPEPFLNLELAKSMVQMSLVRAKFDGEKEEKLQLLQNFLEDIDDLMNPKQVEPIIDPGLLPPEPPLTPDMLPPDLGGLPPEAAMVPDNLAIPA